MHWQDSIGRFLLYLKIERGLSENTVKSYHLDLKSVVNYLNDKQIHERPNGIDKETIQKYLYDLSPLISARSQARTISALKAFFDYLCFENIRDDNPMELIESPKIGRKLPESLSVEEIDQLIGAIDLVHPQGERNRAMLEVLYGCGLRVSELINLRLSNVYAKDGVVLVTGKGNKQRFVPVAPITLKILDQFVREDRIKHKIDPDFSDHIFLNRRGKPLTRAMVFTIIKDLSKKCGINKNIGPHTFRHSFATHLLENGADLKAIQEMLGHESITTTEIYVHLQRSHLTKTLESYHPRAAS